MTETIIFLCGVLSGLVTLLLGYFIRMGIVHNKVIKNLKVDIESTFKIHEETRQHYDRELEKMEMNFDDRINHIYTAINELNQKNQSSERYIDKRIDKLIDSIGSKKIEKTNV